MYFYLRLAYPSPSILICFVTFFHFYIYIYVYAISVDCCKFLELTVVLDKFPCHGFVNFLGKKSLKKKILFVLF